MKQISKKKTYYNPPKEMSRDYIEDIVWLKAFVDSGCVGIRAIKAADQAVRSTSIHHHEKAQMEDRRQFRQ